MTNEEQTYITARDDLYRLFLAFTKAPQALTYIEAKRRVLETWAHERYSHLHFSAESAGPTWDATLDQGNLDFSVTLITDVDISPTDQAAILEEGRAYLAGLGKDVPAVSSLSEQKEI
jgi:hypothetical protein